MRARERTKSWSRCRARTPRLACSSSAALRETSRASSVATRWTPLLLHAPRRRPRGAPRRLCGALRRLRRTPHLLPCHVCRRAHLRTRAVDDHCRRDTRLVSGTRRAARRVHHHRVAPTVLHHNRLGRLPAPARATDASVASAASSACSDSGSSNGVQQRRRRRQQRRALPAKRRRWPAPLPRATWACRRRRREVLRHWSSRRGRRGGSRAPRQHASSASTERVQPAAPCHECTLLSRASATRDAASSSEYHFSCWLDTRVATSRRHACSAAAAAERTRARGAQRCSNASPTVGAFSASACRTSAAQSVRSSCAARSRFVPPRALTPGSSRSTSSERLASSSTTSDVSESARASGQARRARGGACSACSPRARAPSAGSWRSAAAASRRPPPPRPSACRWPTRRPPRAPRPS